MHRYDAHMGIIAMLFRSSSRHQRPRGPRSHLRLEADLLTRPEIEELLDQCQVHSWTGLRNRTLIIVLWRTGLRISEALALREKDIDLVEGRLVVQRGQGRQEACRRSR